MGFLCYLSEYLIPVLIFYILADGIFSGTSVYDEFVRVLLRVSEPYSGSFRHWWDS